MQFILYVMGSKELGYTIDVTLDGIRIDKCLVDQKEKIAENIRKAIEEFMIIKSRTVNNAYELNRVNFLNIEDPRIIDIRDTGMGVC